MNNDYDPTKPHMCPVCGQHEFPHGCSFWYALFAIGWMMAIKKTFPMRTGAQTIFR